MPSHFSERLHEALPDVLADHLHRREPPCSEDNSPEKNLHKRRSLKSHSSTLSPAQQFAEQAKEADHTPDSASMAPTPVPEKNNRQLRFEDDANPSNTENASSSSHDALSEDEDSVVQGAPSTLSTGHSSVNTEKRAYKKWRTYFENDVDPDEELIVRYGCALSESILISGNLFISQRHICFSSNLPGLRRRRVIPLSSVTAVRKHWTLKIAANGLEIETSDAGTLVLGSLMSRDATYDLIMDLWRAQAPEASREFIAAEEREKMESEQQQATAPEGHAPRGATQCGSDPFEETCLDIRLPTTPEKVYNLLCYDDDFILDFWKKSQKLSDIQLGDWDGDGDLKKRTYSYTKPLGGAIGPSSTSCELTDEELHTDPDEYFEVLTVTKTPNVPAGDIFEVQTKMAMAWAGGGKGGTKLLVTTHVDWSGKHMLKSTITKASVDGQRSYWKALAQRIRAHIKQHSSEFATADVVDPDNDDELDEPEPLPLMERMTTGLFDTSDPAKLLLLVLVALLLLSNFYLLFFRSSGKVTKIPVIPEDAELVARVERLEMTVLALKGALQQL